MAGPNRRGVGYFDKKKQLIVDSKTPGTLLAGLGGETGFFVRQDAEARDGPDPR
jgi:hypothetical protein